MMVGAAASEDVNKVNACNILVLLIVIVLWLFACVQGSVISHAGQWPITSAIDCYVGQSGEKLVSW